MRGTDRLLLGFAALGVFIVAAPPEHASTSSRRPAEIAFVSRHALSLVRADGSGRRRLLISPAELLDAAWSPDGETIAFTRGGGVYSFEVDRGRPRFRFKGDEPSWSPDGSKLAFAGYVERNFEIFEVDLRTREFKRLTRSVHGSDDVSPAWSPNGRMIAWVRDPDNRRWLYVMQSGGALKRRVGTVRGEEPAWSPDGKALAYDCGDAICVTDVHGRRIRQLTPGPVAAGFTDRSPDWSPDGQRIAFWRSRDDPDRPLLGEIFVMRSDGSGVRRVTHSNGVSQRSPSWRPR